MNAHFKIGGTKMNNQNEPYWGESGDETIVVLPSLFVYDFPNITNDVLYSIDIESSRPRRNYVLFVGSYEEAQIQRRAFQEDYKGLHLNLRPSIYWKDKMFKGFLPMDIKMKGGVQI